MTPRRRPVASLLAVAAIAGSWVAVRRGGASRLDDPVRDRLERAHGPAVDEFVAGVTDLGSVFGLAGVTTALLVTGRTRAAADVGVSGLLAWTAAQGVKPALERARPYEEGRARRLVSEPAGSSWPSGHAAVAAAMAGALSDRMRPSARWATRLAVLAVGVSRVHVGVHHGTDVIAGWGIGTLCARVWRRACGR